MLRHQLLIIIIIYVKNFKFINFKFKANNDTHKTAKILLTFNIYRGHKVLLLIYAIRPWPYMQIPA